MKKQVLLKRVRVLCVDDQPDSLLLLSTVLRYHGAIVTVCRSAEDAIEEIERKRFDVIVSDLSMPPGMDGYDFVHELRRFEKESCLKPTPTVAVSSDVNTPSKKRHFADFQVYMLKPFNHQHLAQIVDRLAEADSAAVRMDTLENGERSIESKQNDLLAHTGKMKDGEQLLRESR